MTSFGETEIYVDSSTIGKARVLGLFPDSTLFPRLGLTIGVTLHDRPPGSLNPSAMSLVGYEMRNACGELRLAEHSESLGTMSWAGPRRHVRSSAYSSETQIRFTCDLDHWRLDQIERRRDGNPPQFWIQLWPTLVHEGKFLDAEVRPFRIVPSREQWLEFYAKAGGAAFEILELRYGPREAEQFQRAVGRLREARAAILEGEYDQAVSLCRNAFEALRRELPNAPTEALELLFKSSTDDRRMKEYLGIVSRVKQLSGFVHHEFGEPVTYSRAEALAIVRITEAMVSLVGSLISEQR